MVVVPTSLLSASKMQMFQQLLLSSFGESPKHHVKAGKHLQSSISIMKFHRSMTVEEVRSLRVHIEPVAVDVPLVVENGFTTAGTLRSLAAEQVLRAAQVGGLPDARLELAVYDLLAALGQSPGPWIGETLRLGEGNTDRRTDSSPLVFV